MSGMRQGHDPQPDRGRAQHWFARQKRAVILAGALGIVVMISGIGWPAGTSAAAIPPQRHIIPLAPLGLTFRVPGWLEHPVNFGYRCTLVDAAAVLNFYGDIIPQALIALDLSQATDYSAPDRGPPWWAYVGSPDGGTLLDSAITQVAAMEGLRVTAQTILGLDFDRAARAIAHDHPVILNVVRTPDGTYNHSLLAFGEDTLGGQRRLLTLDPNTQETYWVGPGTLWSETLTSTYIAPASDTRLG